MDMNTATLPKKGLKARPYSMDMEDHIVTLPKRGLKTRPYNIGMEKKGLKKYDYNIDMEKKDLKKLTKGQLIKLLLKKVGNHEDLLDNDPFKDEVTQEPTKHIKPTPPLRTGKWESAKLKTVPRKSVNEDGYKPIPKPRTDRPLQMQNARRPPKPTRKPPPVPQVEEHVTNVSVPKIKELNKALKNNLMVIIVFFLIMGFLFLMLSNYLQNCFQCKWTYNYLIYYLLIRVSQNSSYSNH